MLRAIVTQIVLVIAAEHDTIVSQKTCGLHLIGFSPARGAVGLNLLGLTRPPNRHADGDRCRDQAARCGDVGAFHKDRWRIGVIGVPPPEEGGRQVKWKAEQPKPGLAQFRLEGQPPCHPLGRAPNAQKDNRKNGEDLAPENFGCGHGFVFRQKFKGQSRACGQSSSLCRHRRARLRRHGGRDAFRVRVSRARAGSRGRHRSWRSGRRRA